MRNKLLLALLALTIWGNTAHANGVGSGLVPDHPEYQFAILNLDDMNNLVFPPVLTVISNTVTIPAIDQFSGLQTPWAQMTPTTIACSSTTSGTMIYDGAFKTCNGSAFDTVVSGTTAGLMQSHLGVLDTSMSAVVTAFPTKLDLTAYNSGVAVINSNTALISSSITTLSGLESSDVTSLTAAINAKANGKAVSGTSVLTGAFPIFKQATVASGVAVFQLTADGTSSGTALFQSGPIATSVQPIVNDATASYQMGWAFTNSNKTLTVTTNNFTTSNILTGILGQAAANGKVVNLTVWGN